MAGNVKTFPRRSGGETPLAHYKRIRSSLKSGDLLLCAGTHTFSHLIRQATNSCWSHVAFIMRMDSIERVMVLESVESQGVRTIPLRRYLTDYVDGKAYSGGVAIFRHGKFPDVEEAEILRHFGPVAVDMFGYPYDKDQILKLAGRIVWRKLGGSSNRSFDRDNEFICSEYVARCYDTVKIKIRQGKHGFVAPSDFVSDAAVQHVTTLKNPD